MFTESVECLSNGAPHAKEAAVLLDYFNKPPSDAYLALPRVLTTLYLTHLVEELRMRPHFTIAEFKECLTNASEFANHCVRMQEIAHARGASRESCRAEAFETVTQSHYGNLFQSFSEYHYYDEPLKLLKTRYRSSSSIDALKSVLLSTEYDAESSYLLSIYGIETLFFI